MLWFLVPAKIWAERSNHPSILCMAVAAALAALRLRFPKTVAWISAWEAAVARAAAELHSLSQRVEAKRALEEVHRTGRRAAVEVARGLIPMRAFGLPSTHAVLGDIAIA